MPSTRINLMGVWMVPVTDKVDVGISFGPTIFMVKQELPDTLTFTEPGPTVTGLTKKDVNKTTAGVNFGVDVTYLLTKKAGIGGMFRYTWGSVDLDGANDSLTVGGLQIGVARATASTRAATATAFLLILAFGAALRFFHLTAPFVDAHAWRQLDTAAMARNFYEGSFLPVRSAGRLGRALRLSRSRMPADSRADRAASTVTGLHETVGRLVIIAFSLGLIWAPIGSR